MLGRMLGRRIRYGKLNEGKHGVREPLAEDHLLLGVLGSRPVAAALVPVPQCGPWSRGWWEKPVVGRMFVTRLGQGLSGCWAHTQLAAISNFSVCRWLIMGFVSL